MEKDEIECHIQHPNQYKKHNYCLNRLQKQNYMPLLAVFNARNFLKVS